MKNGAVLKNLKTEKTFLHTIKARIINFFFNHTKRHDSIMKTILEGNKEGRRSRSVLRQHQGVVRAELGQTVQDQPISEWCGITFYRPRSPLLRSREIEAIQSAFTCAASSDPARSPSCSLKFDVYLVIYYSYACQPWSMDGIGRSSKFLTVFH